MRVPKPVGRTVTLTGQTVTPSPRRRLQQSAPGSHTLRTPALQTPSSWGFVSGSHSPSPSRTLSSNTGGKVSAVQNEWGFGNARRHRGLGPVTQVGATQPPSQPSTYPLPPDATRHSERGLPPEAPVTPGHWLPGGSAVSNGGLQNRREKLLRQEPLLRAQKQVVGGVRRLRFPEQKSGTRTLRDAP